MDCGWCREPACRRFVPVTNPAATVGVMMHREAPGGVNKLSVDSSCGVNNTFLCSRCSEHSDAGPPSLRGATAPSVPRLPAPVRVTSPPVPRSAHPSPGDASLVARTPSRPGGCWVLDCRTGGPTFLSQSQSDYQVKANNVTEAKTVLVVNSF